MEASEGMGKVTKGKDSRGKREVQEGSMEGRASRKMKGERESEESQEGEVEGRGWG